MRTDYDTCKEATEIAEQLANQVIHGYESPNDEVHNLITENNSIKEIIHEFSDEDFVSQLLNERKEIDSYRVEDRLKFSNAISSIKAEKRKINLKYIFSVSVAAAVIAVSFLLYKTNSHVESETKIISAEKGFQGEVMTPTLISSDGEAIHLESVDKNITVDGVAIVSEGKDLLNYFSNADQKAKKEEFVKYNTLVIPAQCNYTIILEDSTEVILNANSELRYPTKFTGESREVFLKGEAYFNVKKGEKQFIVNSSDVQIKVYGTQFNVNAAENNLVKTLLISGSVGINLNDGNRDRMLEPNQMSIANSTSKTNTIHKINEIDKYLAWTTGYFRYDGDSLETIMKELANWYHLTFEYNNLIIDEIEITGSFEKATSIEDILKSIEEISNVKFIKKGDTYRVINN